MRPVLAVFAGALPLLFSTNAPAATNGQRFQDCPLIGPMADYAAQAQPQWTNWDEQVFVVTEGDEEKEIQADGAVCVQDYPEKEGKSEGTILEITENYKAALGQIGAELKTAKPGYVSAHLAKDGKEYWIRVTASRDDGYEVTELQVEPLKLSLVPPGANDFRLLGHMPTAVGSTPVKKRFDQFDFPTTDGTVSIKGGFFEVDYQWPDEKQPQRRISLRETLANYRAALNGLGAQILRDDPENLSARLDDHGQGVYLYVARDRVVAVEEKPFTLSVQPPTADEMRDKLAKDGHIALYINFDFDKATLKPDSTPVITQVVEFLKRNPDLKVSIEGHTDGIGGHDYNVKLSEGRAAAVVAQIVAAGIDRSRLESAGFGPDKPIAPNDTDEGRARNRRVEMVKAS